MSECSCTRFENKGQRHPDNALPSILKMGISRFQYTFLLSVRMRENERKIGVSETMSFRKR